MQVLGRQGEALIPLLLDIADRGLGGIQAEADRLGATFSSKLAVASDKFNDNMSKLGAALNGLKVTILGPLVTALATLTEQFLNSDLFAKMRASIDELANSGVLEKWAKDAVFFVIDGFATMTRAIATIFPMAAFVVVETMRTITSAIASAFGEAAVLIGNMTIAMSDFLKTFSFLPFIGDSFKTMSEEILTAGGHISNALHQSSNAMASFSKNLAVPAGVDALSERLAQVATGAEQFAARAKKSFDTVREEVTRTTSSADMLTQPLDDAATESGELVKVSGGVGIMFDKATGAIVAMNRELFGTLNLVRQINAESLNPVQ
jgi:methyl-accepting chemotaxis protein